MAIDLVREKQRKQTRDSRLGAPRIRLRIDVPLSIGDSWMPGTFAHVVAACTADQFVRVLSMWGPR